MMAMKRGLAVRMTGMATDLAAAPPRERDAVLRRSLMISLVAFLTLIDLFGSQALLPTLVEVYGVSPAAMGVAVNAAAVGMAAASLGVAMFARRIDRRKGIWISLALLAIPTAMLALTRDLAVFTALRVVQGVFMATAFTLTVTYLSERCTVTALGGAMAAYITGNVASNLVGRLLAVGVADRYGLDASFLCFAAMNLAGAALAAVYFRPGAPESAMPENPAETGGVLEAWRTHLSDPRLRASFAMGFLLLFIFVATFSYANFVLAAAPFALAPATLGLVYFVFVPSMLTTPMAAVAAARFGTRSTYWGAIAAAFVGLLMLFSANLLLFVLGLALVGSGLFFAQSVATAHVGRTAIRDRAAANGLYLASYYAGGITGAYVIGLVFQAQGWAAAVGVLVAMTLGAGVLGRRMTG